jgi:hypothetical protein
MRQQLKAILPELLVVGVLGLFAWWGVARMADFLRSLQSDIAVAIVAAGIAGVVSVVSLAVSKAYETRTAVLQDLRAKKTPLYEGIVGTMFNVVFAGKVKRQEMTPEDIEKWFAETTEKLSIWGSDDLIIAFGRFKKGISEMTDPIHGLVVFEDLLLAIRKDLGHSGRKLKRGEILRLFVTDIDQHLRNE